MEECLKKKAIAGLASVASPPWTQKRVAVKSINIKTVNTYARLTIFFILIFFGTFPCKLYQPPNILAVLWAVPKKGQ